MAKPTAQQCHALTTYFMNKYAETQGKAAVVNRNKTRWGFESMLMDYTPTQARQMIDYYMEHYETPTAEWFLFNYDKIDVAMQEYEEEKVSTAKRRKETEARLEEWRNRWKK